MKVLVLRRLPLAFFLAAGVTTAATLQLSLQISLPLHHVQLAWTLTRVLIQL